MEPRHYPVPVPPDRDDDPDPSPSPSGEPTALRPALHPSITRYLDRVSETLISRVPYSERRAIRAEWEAHLQALVEAHVELGASPDEAVELALEQFGEPARVGKAWLREWKCAHRDPPPPAAICAAMTVFAMAAGLFGGLVSSGAVEVLGYTGLPALLAGPFLPVAAGLWWGLRGRNAPGNRLGVPGLMLLALGASAFLPPPPTFVGSPAGPLVVAGMLLCLWTIIGCGVAGGVACLEMLREGRPPQPSLPAATA